MFRSLTVASSLNRITTQKLADFQILSDAYEAPVFASHTVLIIFTKFYSSYAEIGLLNQITTQKMANFENTVKRL